jgi:pyrimidine operon attenuation protein / uracil phosphoribosyltransferase
MSQPVLDAVTLQRTLSRMAHEVAEANPEHEALVLVGVQRGGVAIAQRLAAALEKLLGHAIPLGAVDVTFHRDDLDRRPAPKIYPTEVPGDLAGKTVVLVDDVFYTGRTIRAALDALHEFGRPSRVQLAVLIDRGHRELPIKPDFVGKNLPTARTQRVEVRVDATAGDDGVWIEGTATSAVP